jgi:outer membrane biosynthesis protein TonB
MMRAVNASKTTTNVTINDDEPIALDSDSELSEVEDVEEEEEVNSKVYENPSFERSNPFPYSYRARMLRYSPRFYLARKLLKKSIKIINAKLAEKKKVDEARKEQKIEEVTETVVEEQPAIVIEKEKSTEKPAEVPEEKVDQELPKEQPTETPQPDEPMQVDESPSKSAEKECEPQQNEILEEKSLSEQRTVKETKVEEKNQQISSNADESSQAQTESEEASFLLTEISKSNIEDIMNRYVFNNSDNNQQNGMTVAVEDFAEKLFMCLQQNKHDIQKAQQIWNEKLHIKYKIREMMERIRRHRAVVDIESFGYKPTHDNPIISSKSSTTNSENDHFEKASRMSTESVSRLIQDVRANVLKREEKQRIENHLNVNDSNYDDSNPFAQQNQGRQGQIIDVQSIINDFRQKNPQEIPRRGRRFKNSFGGHSMDGQSPYNRMEVNARNESYKNNSQGFPEVSLLPVNSFYKNLPQSSGGSPFGQKSSLLQSILTKVIILIKIFRVKIIIFIFTVHKKPSWIAAHECVGNFIDTCKTVDGA